VQDNYYYWASYETLRRLALTSLVVVVKIIDTDFSVLYAVLVSFMSVGVQAYYTPFKEDADDLLTLFFMVNEFLLTLTMLCEQHWAGWTGGSVSGVVIVALTVAALLYALHRAKVVSNVRWLGSWSLALARGRGEEFAAASEKHLAADEEVAQPPASPGADDTLGSHALG
jgi:hypothetical protein